MWCVYDLFRIHRDTGGGDSVGTRSLPYWGCESCDHHLNRNLDQIDDTPKQAADKVGTPFDPDEERCPRYIFFEGP